jgi:hypothetical protein
MVSHSPSVPRIRNAGRPFFSRTVVTSGRAVWYGGVLYRSGVSGRFLPYLYSLSRAHRQNLDFYPTNTTLLLNIFIIEKDIEEVLADLET